MRNCAQFTASCQLCQHYRVLAHIHKKDPLVKEYVRELLKLITYMRLTEKLSVTSFNDKLRSYFKAVILGVTINKWAPILYSMVESYC